MYAKAIRYTRPNGEVIWLAPGSRALQLHEERRTADLNRHLKELDEKERKLQEGTK